MAYCRKCGKLLPDNANHCTVCGAAVSSQPEKFDTGRIPKLQNYGEETRIGRHVEPQEETRIGRPSGPQQPSQNYDGSIPLGQPQPLRPLYQPQQPVQPQQPQQPKKGKKKTSGTLVALYIILGILILALLGVGAWFLLGDRLKSEDPNLGRYEAVSCEVDGEEVGTDGEYVVLKAKGKATLSLEETVDASWTLDGSDLTITTEDEEYTGTLAGSTLTLEAEDKLYTFEKEQPEEEADYSQPTQKATEPRAQGLAWWEGDWYGFWTVLEGKGEMYLMERAAWDVCAQLSLNDDGTGKLHIWDEQEGADQAVWFADISFTDGSDDRGILTVTGGTFLNAQLESGDLTADPTALPYAGFTDLLCVTGSYTDPDDPTNSCTYCLVLRPWGTEWEDVRTGDMTDMPYPNMLPIHYDSWYLPRIREGAEMPAAFDLD